MSDAKPNEPANYAELYPGRFLKGAAFLGRKPVLTIRNVIMDELIDEKSPTGKKKKAVVIFREIEQEMTLSKINGVCLKAMFGSDIGAWIGKRVCLYATDQLMPMPTAKGDDRMCVRIWGSPDIAADMAVEFCPPRRKPVLMTMRAPKLAATPPTDAFDRPADTTTEPKQ